MTRIYLVYFACILQGWAASAQDDSFTGYATASIKEGIADIRTYGFRDAKKTIAYDSTTIQPVGSVSKTVIGLAIMKAIEMGMLSLDADINTYLDFPVKNPRVQHHRPITLRHLATHTSGIRDREKAYREAYTEGNLPTESLRDYLRSYFIPGGKRYATDNFGSDAPGDAYAYSNIGAALAAYVVESATKIPFDQFTERYILQPLGMHHTHWFYRAEDATRYSRLFDGKDKAIDPYTLTTYPDGALKTTIADLARYLQALAAGYRHQSPLLSEKSWDELFRKQFTDTHPVRNIDPKEPNSGIFFMHVKSGMIGHSGSDPGVSAMIFFDPVTGRGKVFMGNEDLNEKNLARFRQIWESLK